MLEALDIARVTETSALDDEVPTTVWRFAPLIGRWEQGLEAPARKTRPPKPAQTNESFDLSAGEPSTETDSP